MLPALALFLAAAVPSQAGANDDTSAKYRAADAALNARYRTVMAFMVKQDAARRENLRKGYEKADGDPGYQAGLLASQRAWLAYRDSQCTLASFEFRGGSAQGMARGVCLTGLTQARTAELAALQRNFSPK